MAWRALFSAIQLWDTPFSSVSTTGVPAAHSCLAKRRVIMGLTVRQSGRVYLQEDALQRLLDLRQLQKLRDRLDATARDQLERRNGVGRQHTVELEPIHLRDQDSSAIAVRLLPPMVPRSDLKSSTR